MTCRSKCLHFQPSHTAHVGIFRGIQVKATKYRLNIDIDLQSYCVVIFLRHRRCLERGTKRVKLGILVVLVMMVMMVNIVVVMMMVVMMVVDVMMVMVMMVVLVMMVMMVVVIRNVLKVAQKESSQVDLDSATMLALISAPAFVISRQIDIEEKERKENNKNNYK